MLYSLGRKLFLIIMAKYTSPDGHIFEGDDWDEVRKLVDAVLGVNSRFAPKATPTTNNQSIPSVNDIGKACKDSELKKFLDFVKQEGSSGIISDNDFKLKTAKKSLSGFCKKFKSITGGASLAALIKKDSINNVYKVDPSAYSNLVQAFNNNP